MMLGLVLPMIRAIEIGYKKVWSLLFLVQNEPRLKPGTELAAIQSQHRTDGEKQIKSQQVLHHTVGSLSS